MGEGARIRLRWWGFRHPNVALAVEAEVEEAAAAAKPAALNPLDDLQAKW